MLYEDLPCRSSCPEIFCNNKVEKECLLRIQPNDVVSETVRFLQAGARRRSPGNLTALDEEFAAVPGMRRLP